MAMATGRHEIAENYGAALDDYLENGSEEALHRAYEIGREALDAQLGLLDVTAIHQRALAAAFEEVSDQPEKAAQRLDMAHRFLAESLSPFELFHLGSREANAALRRLNMIMESEAKRIAHTLHDEAAQLLATVYLELSEIARDAPSSIRAGVSRISEHLDEVREQLRRLSHELRPLILDQLGLVPALRFLADGVSERTNLPALVEGSTEGRLSEVTETAVYRVVQEALANTAKHACATRAQVRVWMEAGMLHCTVEDDGVGFDPTVDRGRSGQEGLGLIGIRERVEALHGNFEVTSSQGDGTVIHVSLPEERSAADADSTG